MLTITVVGNGLRRFNDACVVLGEGKARTAYSAAINRAGAEASKHTAEALTKQTGLPKRTAPKALRKHVRRSTPASLAYTITASGGNVRLKFFKARETRKGVSAAPWNKRQVFASTFMRAGWWPHRVTKPNWNRQVFRRTGSTTKFGKDQFENVKSDLFIPTEVTIGQAAAAWRRGSTIVQAAVEREIRRITKGVVG